MSMMQSYEEMSAEVSAAVDRGYQVALERVDQLIQDGGYDYELSIESLIDEAKSASGFNAAYVLAAYSASMLQQGTSADDMTAKLDAVAEQMFPISSEEKREGTGHSPDLHQHTGKLPLLWYMVKPLSVS